MKNKIYTIFLLGFSMFLLPTCKNPEIGYETFTITDESIEPEVYGAKVNGSFSFSGNVQEMKMKIATDESMTDATDYSTIIDNQTFSAEIEGLEPNTTYYYCYSIDFGWKDDYLTDINSFSTLDHSNDSLTIVTSCNPTTGGMATGGGTFAYGQSCTVTASAATGYTFTNWTENGSVVSTNTSYNFTVNGDRTLVANFEEQAPDTYYINVSANPNNGGTVTGGGNYQQGRSCTVTASAATDYTFTNWTENDSVVSTNTSYTFTVDRNRNLVANFTENPLTTYNITVSANPQEGGSVTGGGTFEEGQSCTITATANSNYTFENWTENGSVVSTNASYTFTVNGDRTLVANFTYVTPTYTISVAANPTNGGTVIGGGTYQQGQSCTVVATPAANYTFNNWTENGSVVSTNSNYIFTVNGNRNLVAHFTHVSQNFTITVSADPDYAGYVTGGGTYQQGQSCSVVATPNANYTFINWTENGSVVCTNANYTFTVNANRTLVANFTAHASSDAINGIFTISPYNDHVYFSKGNLKYIKTTGVWSFMEHQYDMEETNNQNVGADYAEQKVISLFGWGTSGYNHNNAAYKPESTDSHADHYYAYGDPNNDLNSIPPGNADWGVYNIINNSSQNWRTLTREEWRYIMNERETSSLNGVPNARYAKAKVNGVSGLILFPDNYNHPDNIPISGINDPGTSYSNNDYNIEKWEIMQACGCVFLPAAGSRNGATVTVSLGGYYWSSTHNNNSSVYVLYFDNSYLNIEPQSRYIGRSVRLVHPIQ